MTFHRSQQAPVKRRRKPIKSFMILLFIVAFCAAVVYAYSYISGQSPSQSNTAVTTTQTQSSSTGTTAPPATPAKNYCASNTLSQLVLVSIGKQHLWACNGSKTVYDSAVVTGMEQYPADLTPPGTYHIYAKQTNLHLKGCDSTGCWDDPVSYWMPWLDNQYGQYGFHDATWRKPSQFGNVNIYAPNTAPVVGSHGCVELPLATAKWLYGWSVVGTTVTVQS